VKQYFTGFALLPLLHTPASRTSAMGLTMLTYAQAASGSPANANALIQDEVQLVFCGYVYMNQTMLGIRDPVLESQMTALEASIGDNPLYATSSGYQLGLLAATLAGTDLAQPNVVPMLQMLALVEATAHSGR
jgi:hypothetical protein